VDAGKWINQDPMRATKLMEEWTGVEKEVLYLYFSKGGHLTLDPTIKPKWLGALEFDHKVLVGQKLSPALDFKAWITEDYIRKAYAELGMDYEGDKKMLHDPAVAHAKLPAEIWHAREGIKTYPTITELLKAYADYKKVGQKLNATYVYDKATGLKLFGKTAFFVKGKDGSFVAFLRKPDAETFAKAEGGAVMDLTGAVAGFSG
jgi:NitT/TauT family transport system substrate-binding protein